MNIEYGIKNFRVFDKDGARFNLKPITMLTGANCAGKSSLVKSIMLLKQYLDKTMQEGLNYPGYFNISFADQSININGIDTVINNKSGSNKDVVFSLSKVGASSNVKYTIENTFSSVKGDFFNNGWLKKMRFSCEVDNVSEDFLVVSFENYLPVFETFNPSGNILKVFERDLDLYTYSHFQGEFIYVGERGRKAYADAKRSFEALVNRIYNNPLNSTLPLYEHPRKGRLHNDEKYDLSILPPKELDYIFHRLSSFKMKSIEMSLLTKLLGGNNYFYLPILEIIGGKNASELESYILDKGRIEKLFPIVKKRGDSNSKWMKKAIKDYTAIVKSIIDDFRCSGLITFQEYYTSLANKQLAQMNNCEAPIVDFYNSEFISIVKNLFSLPIDIPRYTNVRKQIIDVLPNERDIDISITVFQKVYFVLSCLQRDLSKMKEEGSSNDFLGQPLYKYSQDQSFVWIKESRAGSGWGNIDVPISRLYQYYSKYVSSIVSELCIIEDFQNISQYDSFLCPVRRSYSVYDRTPLNVLLVEYIALRERRRAEKPHRNIRFINKWVKTLGIGESILFELNKEKTDIKILIKNFSGEKVSSADLGHGVTQMLSILINIERHILEKGDVETPYTICIEEPEVSLHPSWQSALGRIFYDAAVNYGIHFIIETHSEYLIRASQLIVAQQKYKSEHELQRSNPFVVYYISKDKGAYDMQYLTSGRFARKFGTGFFDAASTLAFGLYDIENSDK